MLKPFNMEKIVDLNLHCCQGWIEELVSAHVFVWSQIPEYVANGKHFIEQFWWHTPHLYTPGMSHGQLCRKLSERWKFIVDDPPNFLSPVTAYADIPDYASKVYDAITTGTFKYAVYRTFVDSAIKTLNSFVNFDAPEFQVDEEKPEYYIRFCFCPWVNIAVKDAGAACRLLDTLHMPGIKNNPFTDLYQNLIPLAVALKRINGEYHMFATTSHHSVSKEDWFFHQVNKLIPDGVRSGPHGIMSAALVENCRNSAKILEELAAE